MRRRNLLDRTPLEEEEDRQRGFEELDRAAGIGNEPTDEQSQEDSDDGEDAD